MTIFNTRMKFCLSCHFQTYTGVFQQVQARWFNGRANNFWKIGEVKAREREREKQQWIYGYVLDRRLNAERRRVETVISRFRHKTLAYWNPRSEIRRIFTMSRHVEPNGKLKWCMRSYVYCIFMQFLFTRQRCAQR